MINPRTNLIHALGDCQVYTISDYFSYENPLQLGLRDNRKIANLVKVARSPNRMGLEKKLEPLHQAYQLYKNMQTRVYFEGLLIYHGVDQVAQLGKVQKAVLQAYVDYICDVRCMADYTDQALFITLFNNDKAKQWFEQCALRSFEDLVFRLTNKPKEVINRKEALQRLFNRSVATSESLLSFTQESLGSMPEKGLSKEVKSVYDLGLKTGELAVKIATLLDKGGDDDEEDFLSSWDIEMEQDSADTYERVTMSAEMKANLLEQMQKIQPLKQALVQPEETSSGD